MNCRHCNHTLTHQFLDLGEMPPSNDYLSAEDLQRPEPKLPLTLFICERCWLAQTEDVTQPDDLFRHDYAYFSSTSQTWLTHAARYANMITERINLNQNSFVIEIAANDGYLLRNFVTAGIPCLGIEPTAGTAAAAEKIGIPIRREFFGKATAEQLQKADLIIGNNVYAHVPDINDFTQGLKAALKKGGTITLEFPHLMRMLESSQFDTVYHEHFSYLSLIAVSRIFEQSELRAFDVEELCTHGGSLRVYGCHADDARPTLSSVKNILAAEEKYGLRSLAIYQKFQASADRIRDDLLVFLQQQKKNGRKVAGYGAAAKGNTLLNYANITADLLPYVCDAAASKQGKYLPGSHIPILPPAALHERRPDVVLILPWNIAEEVMAQHSAIAGWGGTFAVAVPKLAEYSPATSSHRKHSAS